MGKTCAKEAKDALLFRYVDDRIIDRNHLSARFRRLHALAGLRVRAEGGTPRIQDLRYTFAVHRLTQWIREGANLNELLPALSTYMGYASLTKAGQFLAFVPERFRQDLAKLSPYRGRIHWRDEPATIRFLTSL